MSPYLFENRLLRLKEDSTFLLLHTNAAIYEDFWLPKNICPDCLAQKQKKIWVFPSLFFTLWLDYGIFSLFWFQVFAFESSTERSIAVMELQSSSCRFAHIATMRICVRSQWSRIENLIWKITKNRAWTPNTPLMDDFSVLTGLLEYLDSTQEVELKSLHAQIFFGPTDLLHKGRIFAPNYKIP